jgi:3'-phosphoadenosine 5'-phosphosulfate sulfotransferase (PAPS reductase)/FAD synthetase
MTVSSKELIDKQSRSLNEKIEMSQCVIEQWWKYWDGQVYVAFSGGKDSNVLLRLVRNMFPDTVGMFSDTGLEYPEIKEFVKTIDNIDWVRPKLSYRQVIERWGYPIISKQVSMGIDRATNTKSEVQKNLRLYGGINPTSGKKQRRDIPPKWHYLLDAPFKISERCCEKLKKQPSEAYSRKTGKKQFIGNRVEDSGMRRLIYYKQGCNAYETKNPTSCPLSFWLEEDVWEYHKLFNLPYSKIYDMGETKTGCMWCMFGVHLDSEPNRFQRMRKTHPKIYNYCINNIGLGAILDYIKVPYV